MLRLVSIFFFNLIAVYVFMTYLFGNGGVRDYFSEMEKIIRYEKEKMEISIELENLKSELYELQVNPKQKYRSLMIRGMKTPDMVIFRFQEEPAAIPERGEQLKSWDEVVGEISLTVAVAVILVVTGNLLILYRGRKRGGNGYNEK